VTQKETLGAVFMLRASGLTRREIGKTIGVSPSRVGQIIQSVNRKLRLGEMPPDSDPVKERWRVEDILRSVGIQMKEERRRRFDCLAFKKRRKTFVAYGYHTNDCLKGCRYLGGGPSLDCSTGAELHRAWVEAYKAHVGRVRMDGEVM